MKSLLKRLPKNNKEFTDLYSSLLLFYFCADTGSFLTSIYNKQMYLQTLMCYLLMIATTFALVAITLKYEEEISILYALGENTLGRRTYLISYIVAACGILIVVSSFINIKSSFLESIRFKRLLIVNLLVALTFASSFNLQGNTQIWVFSKVFGLILGGILAGVGFQVLSQLI